MGYEKNMDFFNGGRLDMSTIKYYSSQDKQFAIQHPSDPFWRSVCHNQPVMENSYSIFIDEELSKAYGSCRRCGHDSELQNGNIFWDVYWKVKTDEIASSM